MSTKVLITYSIWTDMIYRWVQQTYYVAGGVLDTQRPGVVARYYVDCIKQMEGAARVVRAD